MTKDTLKSALQNVNTINNYFKYRVHFRLKKGQDAKGLKTLHVKKEHSAPPIRAFSFFKKRIMFSKVIFLFSFFFLKKKIHKICDFF